MRAMPHEKKSCPRNANELFIWVLPSQRPLGREIVIDLSLEEGIVEGLEFC
jgi:hypothetical protein